MRAFEMRPDVSRREAARPGLLKLSSGQPAWGARAARVAWRLPASLALWAAFSFAGAGAAFWLHLRSEIPTGSPAFAGILLVLLALAQCWLAWRLRPTACAADLRWLSLRGWLRACFVGAAASYAIILLVGSQRGGSMLFIAVTMSWGTLITLPLAAHPDTIDRWRQFLRRPGLRWGGNVAFPCCVALLCLEGGLRVCGLLWGPRFLESAAPVHVTYAQRSELDAGAANEFARDGQRVAVMGDFQVIGVDEPRVTEVVGNTAGEIEEQPASISLLETALPGIDVVHIAAPRARLRDYADAGLQKARAVGPKLLLVFVSVGDDIAAEPQQSNPFDWRSLSTCRAVVRLTGWSGGGRRDDFAAANDPLRTDTGRWEDYVQACAPQLAACRRPIDSSMQQRWKSTFAYFDKLEAGCRQAGIRLALVVAPSPVQTNRALLEAVCRRQGCTSADVDLELPQRRLAVYAAERNLPALDLLPSLKQSSDAAFVHQGRQWTDAGRATVARTLDGWLRSTFATVVAPVRAPLAAAWNPGDEDRLVAH